MSSTKSSSRLSTQKKDSGSRYATRLLALEKGKRNNPVKETSSAKSCNCLVKSDGGKGGKTSQNSKLPVKKTNTKCISKDTKKRSSSANHREKVVIVSKRSSSVSVVKSCKLRKSVSVKKVSYSTSVVLSSEEEDEEDTDSEDEDSEDEEERKREISRKKRTVLKRTTSKVRSSVRETKKTDNKAKKKDKAIEKLCEKLSSGKHRGPSRELRPRFPYSNVLQEWPTARTHRMASLNALAKVHVLYENEGKVPGENANEADETSLIDFLDDDSDEDSDSKRDIKPIISNLKKQEKVKAIEDKPKSTKKEKTKPKIIRRTKKRKLPEVEIIDTRVCKRMASLNASAILAASYQFEPKPKQTFRRLEKCYNSSDTETEVDLSIVKIEKEDEEDDIIETSQLSNMSEKHKLEDIKIPPDEQTTKSTEHSFSKRVSKLDVKNQKSLASESEVTIIENKTSAATVSNRSCTVASAAATTQVGMTKYTEVTKVQINTHKDSAIKEESKSERKIKHVVSNEDVAITQMYRYQSETANESYTVQMQTTYKPGSKSMASTTNLPSSSEMFPRDNTLPSTSGYFGHTSMLPSQAYPSVGPMPPAGIDRRLPRHYGASAFSVPHYKHSQHMPFPPNEYGYYQPAGPLIQPPQDPVIHKPVPYHPQPNPNQTPQRPQPTPHHEGFQGFEPRQPQQNKPATLSHSPSEQKSIVPSVPKSEAQTQSSPSTQVSRSSQSDSSRNRSPSSNPSTSFQQPSKHVRSPVMPTLYSSQNSLRSYQTQKRMPSTFGSFSQALEKKDKDPKLVGYDPRKDPEPKLVGYDSRKEHRPKLVGYNPVSHASTSIKSSSDAVPSQSSFQSTSEVQYQSQPSTSHSTGHFKNTSGAMSPNQRRWDYKPSHGTSSSYHASLPSRLYSSGASSGFYNKETSSNAGHTGSTSKLSHDASSNFLPYRSSFRKDVHQSNLSETYPRRSPPVITLDEDSPRDTKTFIQLEVPKNSHREKIVVVDVEDDDIDPKHNYTETSNVQSTSLNKSQGYISRIIPLKQASSSTVTSHQIPESLDKRYNLSKNISLNSSASTFHNPAEKQNEYSRNSNIPYQNFEKSQGNVENKSHSNISNLHRPLYDKDETKQAHLRNADESKPTIEKPQPEREKTQAQFSKPSPMPSTSLDRPKHQTEKKHTYLFKSDVPKETSTIPQDKMERKQNHSKDSDINKAIFNRPQLTVEIKQTSSNLKSSDKMTLDRLQDKTEKEPIHTACTKMDTPALDKHQNKSEDHTKPTESIGKNIPTFDSPQEKNTSSKKSIQQSSHDKKGSTLNNPPLSISPDISIVKVEKMSDSDSEPVKKKTPAKQNKKCDKSSAESLEAATVEVKKKKESAVVRRAKMQGKQRTFRDCYNRPLEQLSKSKKKGEKRESSNLIERSLTKEFQPQVSLTRLVLPKVEKPPPHGWSWEGTPCDRLVYLSNDDPPVMRRCYPSIRHVEGDIICERDCVFLRSGPRKTDVPFVAKVTALWEMPTTGEMTMSLLWYYRPEHTEMGKKFPTFEDEILASKHRDINSVACIEDKCYVLTYSEYCRYKKRCRVMEDSTALTFSPVPEGDEEYQRTRRLPPPDASPDLVLFCRRVYDYRQKRLLKNPL